jgi:hypothetical protein
VARQDYPWVLICPQCLNRVIGSLDSRDMILSQSCQTPGCQWTWEHIPQPVEAA